MPADRGGVEEDFGALHRGESGALWKPLIPAHQRADRRHLRLPRDEAGVAGREVELFVEQRIVRDVHLAIHAHQRPVGVDYRRGVVIDAGGALLEERGDDHRLVLLRQPRECVGRRARNRFREREEAMVFHLAEILGAEQLLGAENLRAFLERALREGQLMGEVLLGILTAAHLRQTDFDGRRRGHSIYLTRARKRCSAPGYLPCCMAERNSLFVLVLLIFERSSSMASTGESGVSTRRST